MVHPEVIRKRLNKLEEYLGILEQLQREPEEDFVANPLVYGAAERFLHLAIETLNDMGGHVVADNELGTVEWQRDIPKLLCEKGLLSQTDQQVWIQMIGFRNVLVHDYLKIDRQLVYQILTTRTTDIRRIAGTFARYL